VNRLLFNLVPILALTTAAANTFAPPQAPAAVPTTAAAGFEGRCAVLTDQTPSTEQSPTTENSLRLVTIEPIADTRVQRSTVLVADLAFTVKDFDSGKYRVFAQFDTTTPGRSTDGTFDSYPSLKYASGNYRLCFPLTDIWNVANLKRPLSVRFMLNKIDDARHNHAIAITDRLSFPTN
jgi:hypothetical protein